MALDELTHEFFARANRTKNFDQATIAAAAATRVDALKLAARHDAFPFAFTAKCKATTLTGRALRIFRAAHGFMRAASFGGGSFWGLRLAVTARRNEP